MPACKTTEAEAERRKKISDAMRGVPKGPRKPWGAEACAEQSNVVQLRWAGRSSEQRANIGAKISASLGNGAVEDPDSKRCKGCGVRPRIDFGEDRRSRDGLQGLCRECVNTKAKEWAAEHPDRIRDFRRNRYNIDFNALWEKQEGKCSLCGELMLPRGKGSRSVVIDHDHNCCPPRPGRAGSSCGKCVRGLIHRDCNLLLGLIEKNQARLQLAESYLKRWQEKSCD